MWCVTARLRRQLQAAASQSPPHRGPRMHLSPCQQSDVGKAVIDHMLRRARTGAIRCGGRPPVPTQEDNHGGADHAPASTSGLSVGMTPRYVCQCGAGGFWHCSASTQRPNILPNPTVDVAIRDRTRALLARRCWRRDHADVAVASNIGVGDHSA